VKLLALLGGVLVAPRRAFARLAADERAPTWPVLVLLGAACIVSLPVALLQEALVARVGLASGASALAEVFARWALLPVGVLVALWLAAATWLRARTGRLDGRRAVGLAAAAGWLYVPWFVMLVLGKASAAVGWNATWLPHLPVTLVDGTSITRVAVGVAWSVALLPVLVSAAASPPPAVAPPGAGQSSPSPQERRAMWAGLAVLALALAGIGLAARDMRAAYPAVRPVLRGDLAPDIELPSLAGRSAPRIRLSALRGKVVVVDFWATWCAPCVRSLPALDALYRELHAAGLEVVAVNRDSPTTRAEVVRRFMTEHALSLPVAVDALGTAAAAYRVSRLPTTYVLDRNGVVADTWVGVADAGDLGHTLRALLAAPGVSLPAPAFAAPPAPLAPSVPPASPAPPAPVTAAPPKS
jgi:peroxiredoxin